MVIFLSNFLALLIKADAGGQGGRSLLGGVMVAINILLIVAVLSASYLAAQQTVEDHLDGGNVEATVVGAMRTLEQRAAAKSRFTSKRMTASTSSVRSRVDSNDGVDGFNRGEGLSARVWPRALHEEGRASGTSGAATSDPAGIPVAHALIDEGQGLASSILTRAAPTRVSETRGSLTTMPVEARENGEHNRARFSLSEAPSG